LVTYTTTYGYLHTTRATQFLDVAGYTRLLLLTPHTVYGLCLLRWFTARALPQVTPHAGWLRCSSVPPHTCRGCRCPVALPFAVTRGLRAGCVRPLDCPFTRLHTHCCPRTYGLVTGGCLVGLVTRSCCRFVALLRLPDYAHVVAVLRVWLPRLQFTLRTFGLRMVTVPWLVYGLLRLPHHTLHLPSTRLVYGPLRLHTTFGGCPLVHTHTHHAFLVPAVVPAPPVAPRFPVTVTLPCRAWLHVAVWFGWLPVVHGCTTRIPYFTHRGWLRALHTRVPHLAVGWFVPSWPHTHTRLPHWLRGCLGWLRFAVTHGCGRSTLHTHTPCPVLTHVWFSITPVHHTYVAHYALVVRWLLHTLPDLPRLHYTRVTRLVLVVALRFYVGCFGSPVHGWFARLPRTFGCTLYGHRLRATTPHGYRTHAPGCHVYSTYHTFGLPLRLLHTVGYTLHCNVPLHTVAVLLVTHTVTGSGCTYICCRTLPARVGYAVLCRLHSSGYRLRLLGYVTVRLTCWLHAVTVTRWLVSFARWVGTAHTRCYTPAGSTPHAHTVRGCYGSPHALPFRTLPLHTLWLREPLVCYVSPVYAVGCTVTVTVVAVYVGLPHMPLRCYLPLPWFTHTVLTFGIRLLPYNTRHTLHIGFHRTLPHTVPYFLVVLPVYLVTPTVGLCHLHTHTRLRDYSLCVWFTFTVWLPLRLPRLLRFVRLHLVNTLPLVTRLHTLRYGYLPRSGSHHTVCTRLHFTVAFCWLQRASPSHGCPGSRCHTFNARAATHVGCAAGFAGSVRRQHNFLPPYAPHTHVTFTLVLGWLTL